MYEKYQILAKAYGSYQNYLLTTKALKELVCGGGASKAQMLALFLIILSENYGGMSNDSVLTMQLVQPVHA